MTSLHPQELAQRAATGDPVDRQARVALELPEGGRGGVTHDAVHPPGVEAQGPQALLEVGHVVAALHGSAAVQEPVAQCEAGLDQGVPGLRPADPVDPQAAPVLERLERGPGPGAEDAVGVDGGAAGCDGGQTVLDVGDRVTAVADGEWQAYR